MAKYNPEEMEPNLRLYLKNWNTQNVFKKKGIENYLDFIFLI